MSAHTVAEPVRLVESPIFPAKLGRRLSRWTEAIAIAAGVLSILGGLIDPTRFAFSYLTAFCFVAGIASGAIFWVMAHHVCDAGWSVVVRRLAENLATIALGLIPMFIPLVFVLGRLYPWTRPLDHFEGEARKLLVEKRPWLNPPRFLIFSLVYLSAWAWLSRTLGRLSKSQDRSGDPDLSRRMGRASALGLFVLAITSTFAAFDWLMSLDYRWASTIFGVYFWAGSFVASLAALTLLVVALRAAGALSKTITVEHLHDLGKLQFGFVIFWAYIAFSQYFLIWYGNLPEETRYFLSRRTDEWNGLSWALAIGGFPIPFLALVARASKRSPLVLAGVSLWLLVFHYLDLYWQTMPMLSLSLSLSSARASSAAIPAFRPHWLDAATLVALLAVSIRIVVAACLAGPLVPIKDPRLAESLTFRNM